MIIKFKKNYNLIVFTDKLLSRSYTQSRLEFMMDELLFLFMLLFSSFFSLVFVN